MLGGIKGCLIWESGFADPGRRVESRQEARAYRSIKGDFRVKPGENLANEKGVYMAVVSSALIVPVRGSSPL